MRNSTRLLGLLAIIQFFLPSCMKNAPLALQQQATVISDSLVVGPSPRSVCYPIREYLDPDQGGVTILENEVATDSPFPWSLNFSIPRHTLPEVFPAAHLVDLQYKIFPLGPQYGSNDFSIDDPTTWTVAAHFNSVGQLTILNYNNDYMKLVDPSWVEYPDLTFHYSTDYKLTSIDRHWPDGSNPDDVQTFKYDVNGNIINMVTLPVGVTDPARSTLTVALTYGAATTSRQFYAWFQGGAFHNSASIAIAENLCYISSFRPKNLLLRVDRYEPTGSGPSHFVDIISHHQFTGGRLTQFTDDRTSPDAPTVHLTLKWNIIWFCFGPYKPRY